MAPRNMLFQNPVHPYTRALLAAVPRTDPAQRLDLTALMEGRASDPAAWPEPFSADGTSQADWVQIGQEHFVRARERVKEGRW